MNLISPIIEIHMNSKHWDVLILKKLFVRLTVRILVIICESNRIIL
jgi:hypothetical protein